MMLGRSGNSSGGDRTKWYGQNGTYKMVEISISHDT